MFYLNAIYNIIINSRFTIFLYIFAYLVHFAYNRTRLLLQKLSTLFITRLNIA